MSDKKAQKRVKVQKLLRQDNELVDRLKLARLSELMEEKFTPNPRGGAIINMAGGGVLMNSV